jgi:hypothetical protein
MAFYYKYILGLKEPDEMTEKIGNMEFGNVLHDVMCELYKPFVSQIVSKEALEQLKKDQPRIKSLVNDSFRNEMKIKGEIKGINALGLEAVKKYVYNLINADINRTPFVYLAGEQKFTAGLQLKKQEGNSAIGFQGTIDRLDKTDSELFIIDYKSGSQKGKQSAVPMEDLFDRFRKPDLDHAFQGMFYAWLTDSQEGGKAYEAYKLKPLLYYSKLSSPVHQIMIEKKEIVDYRDLLADFENKLNQLIGEIYNPAIPFAMTDKKTLVCENCPYYGLCYGV